MSRQLPVRPNLEYLKNEAKDLLRAATDHPGWSLSDAQHALAREYGFDSWPKLKAYVESVAVSAASPFTGTWEADMARSQRHAAHQFQRATLHLSAQGDTVTIAHDYVDDRGARAHGTNTLQVDGVEHAFPFGYSMTAAWRDRRTIDLVTTQHGGTPLRARYQVSADGSTMTVATGEQRLVFRRVDTT